ncbi:MAG TPA: oligosaccharide flippase family protein [Candidatus Deferrimicrobiaceae bacterium]|jgi:O-antigen/teichoic acid export membrane protein
MSRVKKNFIANLAGSGWTALLGLACTPLYIKFLGMEAYGLIGFYLTMNGVIQILDLGLSPTMTREMARYSALPEKAGEARDFVRTLEIGYWAIGLLIGAVVYFAAPLIATHWIKPGRLTPDEVLHAIRIMGALAALQWPFSFYQGGLIGLQRQVLLNGLSIAMATLSSVGAVLILWRVSPTVSAFFTWQIAVWCLQVVLITVALWRCLPATERPARITPALVRNVWQFAAGMSGITLSALILTQIDKVILSKLLDLTTFGYYMLASVITTGISSVLITPMFNTVFPRFSALVAEKDEKGLTDMYHGSTQVMAVLILPVAAVLCLFSHEVMMLWTQNTEVARNTAPIVTILVIGTALNGLMNLPYALQLAHGWTKIGLQINTVFIFTLVPTILFLATRYGAVGAAAVWVLLNGTYMAVGVPLTHRRLLQGEAGRWFLRDVGLPLTGSLLVVLIGKQVLDIPPAPIPAILSLGALLLLAFTVAALATPQLRYLLMKPKVPGA